MDSMSAIFAPALEKYTRNLLARIALDYNLNEAELITKYLSSGITFKPASKPRAIKEPAKDRQPCPGLTSKKTPCKHMCAVGLSTCQIHSGIPRVPKVPAPASVALVATAPAPVALAPVPEPTQFEEVPVSMSYEEQLRMILMDGDDDDEEEFN